MKNLSESILHELNRQDIMSNQNVIDIINSYSSRKNHLKYKIKGNQAEFEDGTIIKFTLNGDDEIEYYTINSQGDTSKTALVHDFSLLDNLTESTSIDVNNLTKEQLWKLRQEIVLGSLYTHDYDNSFGIDPSAVCSFFDSFIEDSQVDDFGKPIDREVEEYDNAEDLYNYYRSCENPFGEIESINESSNKRKLKEDVDWSKRLDDKVIEAREREICYALKEYFTKAGYEVLGVNHYASSVFRVQVYLSIPKYNDIDVYIDTGFSKFELNALNIVGKAITIDELDKLNKLAEVASNINSSLNLLDIIK